MKLGSPLHPCISLLGPGTRIGKRLAGVRGRSALWKRGILLGMETTPPPRLSGGRGLSHHWVSLGLGMGSSPGRHPFLLSLLSFLRFPRWHSCSRKIIGPHPCSPETTRRAVRVMPIAQMGLLNPARLVFPFLSFSPGSGKAGSPGGLALQGTGGRHLPGWPQPVGGGFLLLFSATPGRPWAAATRHGPRLSGLACGSRVMSEYPPGPGGAGTPALSPSPLSWRQRGASRDASPTPLGWRQLSVNPEPGFPEPRWGPPLQWVAVKIALAFS